MLIMRLGRLEGDPTRRSCIKIKKKEGKKKEANIKLFQI